MYIWIYQHSWDSSVSTTWWEMHAPNNMMELPFPPCACGHMHTPQTICAAGFGKQRAQRKKRDWQISTCLFLCFRCNSQIRACCNMSLLLCWKPTRFMERRKKNLQSISFNSSSVAEVIGWQLCVSSSISKQCLSLKTNSCQLHSPKSFQRICFC